MRNRLQRALGWVIGPPCALVIVLAVHVFERGFRIETRRHPAWRSGTP